MSKILAMIFTGIIVSFYYFPFEFSFLPGVNTKMGLAVVGVGIVILTAVRKRELNLSRDFLCVVLLALVVSLIGILSNTLNSTPDYVYATYIVSMIVWVCAALVPVTLMKQVHGKVNPVVLTYYLAAVCVTQCVLAQIIDANIHIKQIVDTYIIQGQDFLNKVDRLYGIGANLDVAGSRFAAVLILLVYITSIRKNITRKELSLVIVAFLIIAVLGSMVARTTYVGVVVVLIYVLCQRKSFEVSKGSLQKLAVINVIMVMSIVIFIHLYHNNIEMKQMFRFAFEGFFNLAETGEWSIASNDKLKTMYVLPDNIKTWIIGDGYFNNPINVDPYYVGEITGGYYKGTDVGYLRFIFYFGIIGLVAFSYFFIKVTQNCMSAFPKYKMLFILLLLANFIIWFKVSTDIFLVFALFLCVPNIQDETPQLEEEEV